MGDAETTSYDRRARRADLGADLAILVVGLAGAAVILTQVPADVVAMQALAVYALFAALGAGVLAVARLRRSRPDPPHGRRVGAALERRPVRRRTHQPLGSTARLPSRGARPTRRAARRHVAHGSRPARPRRLVARAARRRRAATPLTRLDQEDAG
ncbi:hypothetical protein [Aeromicrobium sp. REDSEA-S32_B7]|uniref:hypothetical protein n=1 Tax=Aeromicrobium sp. REDSEA-S32_B7 TaxID=1811526 RepID=UPI002952B4C9|nr:hypothetical protein [Aeromicrobium sp. REDSEA-S32_B7]